MFELKLIQYSFFCFFIHFERLHFCPQGCQFCNHTGYKGRIAVHEIMYLNEELKNAIADKVSLDKLRELAKENGMVPLFDACKQYVLKGVTSIQELMGLKMEQ